MSFAVGRIARAKVVRHRGPRLCDQGPVSRAHVLDHKVLAVEPDLAVLGRDRLVVDENVAVLRVKSPHHELAASNDRGLPFVLPGQKHLCKEKRRKTRGRRRLEREQAGDRLLGVARVVVPIIDIARNRHLEEHR
eukprot:Amastigsp_a847131_2.p2 type:complete len:135 gc:universal Amastigsp_a847131_2:584-180(-)